MKKAIDKSIAQTGTPTFGQQGFTLIELMVTIAIVAVLMSIAVPSMRTYVLNNRLNSASQEFLRTLQTARSEATKRGRNVVVCPSANPLAGAASRCTTGTPNGWIMFDDVDSNGDNSNATELLSAHSFDSSKMTMAIDAPVSYATTGFANVGSGQAMVMCDSRGNVDSSGGTTQTNSVARGIAITPTGRARITKVLSEITTLGGC
ncbi:MAG: GspH/FimT family pseudopilin [Steroidobacteraceae bacterium]